VFGNGDCAVVDEKGLNSVDCTGGLVVLLFAYICVCRIAEVTLELGAWFENGDLN